MNPYEAARERLERASQQCRDLRTEAARITAHQAEAEAEWSAATRNLRQYETTPGIPMPEYREQVTA